jgi:hypothetical protein
MRSFDDSEPINCMLAARMPRSCLKRRNTRSVIRALGLNPVKAALIWSHSTVTRHKAFRTGNVSTVNQPVGMRPTIERQTSPSAAVKSSGTPGRSPGKIGSGLGSVVSTGTTKDRRGTPRSFF